MNDAKGHASTLLILSLISVLAVAGAFIWALNQSSFFNKAAQRAPISYRTNPDLANTQATNTEIRIPDVKALKPEQGTSGTEPEPATNTTSPIEAASDIQDTTPAPLTDTVTEIVTGKASIPAPLAKVTQENDIDVDNKISKEELISTSGQVTEHPPATTPENNPLTSAASPAPLTDETPLVELMEQATEIVKTDLSDSLAVTPVQTEAGIADTTTSTTGPAQEENTLATNEVNQEKTLATEDETVATTEITSEETEITATAPTQDEVVTAGSEPTQGETIATINEITEDETVATTETTPEETEITATAPTQDEVVTADSELTKEDSASVGSEIAQQEIPDEVLTDKSSDQEAAARRKNGWIYAGQYKNGRWVKRGLELPDTQLPDPGNIYKLIWGSNVRLAPPGKSRQNGSNLAKNIDYLAENNKVEITEVKNSGKTGHIWLEIKY